ncbi:MAG: YigZ family protein [Alteromonadaceae bacterium]|nr:MAG: YigZ family protein [Alteromonadaceae bacterium]
MLPKNYFVPAETVFHEYEVKKSRFIACASYAAEREQAMAQLLQAKQQYPDARHHCWAYLIGSPLAPATMAMSDDGEPSGTAGKPILNVLRHKDIGDIMLIVTRYFGGIKLGAGGLVRAYSRATQGVIDQLSLREQQFFLAVTVSGEFALEQSLRHWLSLHAGVLDEVCYSEQVQMHIRFPGEHQPLLEAFVLANGATLAQR